MSRNRLDKYLETQKTVPLVTFDCIVTEEEGERRRRKGKGGSEDGGEGRGGENANPTYCVLMNVFLDVLPCGLVEVHRHFKGTAASYSETSVKCAAQ